MSFFHALMGFNPAVVVTYFSPVSGLSSPYQSYTSGYENSDTLTFTVKRDGSWAFTSSGAGSDSGDWVNTGKTATIGDTHWVRFTQTANSSSGGYSATASTGWQQLSSDRSVVGSFFYPGYGSSQSDLNVTYSVEIATDFGGSSVVSTSSVTLRGDSQYE